MASHDQLVMPQKLGEVIHGHKTVDADPSRMVECDPHSMENEKAPPTRRTAIWPVFEQLGQFFQCLLVRGIKQLEAWSQRTSWLLKISIWNSTTPHPPHIHLLFLGPHCPDLGFTQLPLDSIPVFGSCWLRIQEWLPGTRAAKRNGAIRQEWCRT